MRGSRETATSSAAAGAIPPTTSRSSTCSGSSTARLSMGYDSSDARADARSRARERTDPRSHARLQEGAAGGRRDLPRVPRALRLRPYATQRESRSRATRARPTGCARRSSSTSRARASGCWPSSSCLGASRRPFQTVVLYPASDALFLSNHRAPSMSYADYIVRSGRALVYPIYEHTYGRGSSPRRRRHPRRHHRASRPGDPLGARDAPLDGLRGDAARHRHDALRLRRHQLGRPCLRRDARRRATLPRGRAHRPRPLDVAACDPKKIPSTSFLASASRCSC